MIMRQVRSVQDRPEVQSVAGVVSAQAGQVVEKARKTFGGRFGSDDQAPLSGDPADRHTSNGLGAVPAP
jgi:hypothetical protein